MIWLSSLLASKPWDEGGEGKKSKTHRGKRGKGHTPSTINDLFLWIITDRAILVAFCGWWHSQYLYAFLLPQAPQPHWEPENLYEKRRREQEQEQEHRTCLVPRTCNEIVFMKFETCHCTIVFSQAIKMAACFNVPVSEQRAQ